MIIFGGSVGNGDKITSLNEILIFDLQIEKWEKITPNGEIPSPREGHAACLIN